MDISCTAFEKEVLDKIAIAARSLHTASYVIGGFVRDKIMERETKDIDVVCIGDGIALAHETAKHFNPVPQVNFFKNFGTAQIRIEIPALSNETAEKVQKNRFTSK
ncbi:MAG: hypothetical protein V9E88_15615 [Ferruginibacter sp.]